MQPARILFRFDGEAVGEPSYLGEFWPVQGGVMGIATVMAGLAVSAFMKWRNAVAEAERKLEEFRKKNIENEAAMRNANFGKSIEEHGKLRAVIDAAVNAYSRQFSAQAALDNAEKGWRMAEFTLQEKEAMNALDPDGELGRSKVTVAFAEKRRNRGRARVAEND